MNDPFDDGQWGVRNGSYWLPGIDGTRTRYQRVTNFAGVPSDTYKLTQWKMRQVLRGVAAHRDLAALANATPAADKNALNRIAQQAMDRVASDAKANIGTAIHAEIERRDRGELVAIPDPSIARVVDATQQALADADLAVMPDMIEQVIINDEWQCAGRLDRGVRALDGTVYILDFKSGNIDFAMPEIEIQLAAYARARRWWVAAETATPVPHVIDRDTAIVVLINEENGTAELRDVDIARGARGAQVALDVKQWRREPHTHTPHQTETLADRIGKTHTIDALTQLWATNARRWTPEHTRLAAIRKAALTAHTN